MELVQVLVVLNAVFLVLSVVFGKKYSDAKKLLKELAEALDTTYKAIEDNKITERELKDVIKQWRDVLILWKKVTSR